MGREFKEFSFKEDVELMSLNYEMKNRMNYINTKGESFNTIRSSEAYNQILKDKWQS